MILTRLASRFISAYGKLAWRHNYLVPIFGLVVAIALSMGQMKVHMINEPDDLWLHSDDYTLVDRSYRWQHFEHSREELFITTGTNAANNVLTKEALSSAFDVHERILSLSITAQGRQFAYHDLCLQYGPAGCYAMSVLDYWHFNRSIFMQDEDILATISNPNAQGNFGPIVRPFVIGGIKYEADDGNNMVDSSSNGAQYSSNKVASAGAFKSWYYLDVQTKRAKEAGVDPDDWVDIVKQFEDAYLDELENINQESDSQNYSTDHKKVGAFPGIYLYRKAQRSDGDEIGRQEVDDLPLILAVFFAFFVLFWILIAFSGRHTYILSVKHRWHWALMIGALLTLCLSLSAGLGMLSLFNHRFYPGEPFLFFIVWASGLIYIKLLLQPNETGRGAFDGSNVLVAAAGVDGITSERDFVEHLSQSILSMIVTCTTACVGLLFVAFYPRTLPGTQLMCMCGAACLGMLCFLTLTVFCPLIACAGKSRNNHYSHHHRSHHLRSSNQTSKYLPPSNIDFKQGNKSAHGMDRGSSTREEAESYVDEGGDPLTSEEYDSEYGSSSSSSSLSRIQSVSQQYGPTSSETYYDAQGHLMSTSNMMQGSDSNNSSSNMHHQDVGGEEATYSDHKNFDINKVPIDVRLISYSCTGRRKCSMVVRLLLFSAGLVLACVGIYGSTQWKQNFLEYNLFQKDSYLHDYLYTENKYFGDLGVPVDVLLGDGVDYTSPIDGQGILDMTAQLNSVCLQPEDIFVRSWYDFYLDVVKHTHSKYNITLIDGKFPPPDTFMMFFQQEFLSNYTAGVYFGPQFSFGQQGQILSSRFQGYTIPIVTMDEQAAAVTTMHTFATSQSVNTKIFSPPFTIFRQYTTIKADLLRSFIVAGVAVVLFSFLSLSFRMMIRVVLGVTCTNIILIGVFIHYADGFNLDSLTLPMLIILPYFAFDFVMHFASRHSLAFRETSAQEKLAAMDVNNSYISTSHYGGLGYTGKGSLLIANEQRSQIGMRELASTCFVSILCCLVSLVLMAGCVSPINIYFAKLFGLSSFILMCCSLVIGGTGVPPTCSWSSDLS